MRKLLDISAVFKQKSGSPSFLIGSKSQKKHIKIVLQFCKLGRKDPKTVQKDTKMVPSDTLKEVMSTDGIKLLDRVAFTRRTLAVTFSYKLFHLI